LINIAKKCSKGIINTYILCPTCNVVFKLKKQIMCPECHASLFNIENLLTDIEERIDYLSSIVYKDY